MRRNIGTPILYIILPILLLICSILSNRLLHTWEKIDDTCIYNLTQQPSFPRGARGARGARGTRNIGIVVGKFTTRLCVELFHLFSVYYIKIHYKGKRPNLFVKNPTIFSGCFFFFKIPVSIVIVCYHFV